MPAKSEAQRRAAMAALAALEKGDKSSLKGPAKEMAKGMSKEQLSHFKHMEKKGSKK